MTITRRTFIASTALAASALVLPGRAGAVPVQYVKLTGPVFGLGLVAHIDREWLKQCVMETVWQFDLQGLDGRPLIRHPMTGLTYVVFPEWVGRPAVQQIAATCCPCREDLDPDRTVAHAARYVAVNALRHAAEWDGEHPARSICVTRASGSPWPRLPVPHKTDAPPIVVTPLSGEPGVADIAYNGAAPENAPPDANRPRKIRRVVFLHTGGDYAQERRAQLANIASAWHECDLTNGIPHDMIRASSWIAYAYPLPHNFLPSVRGAYPDKLIVVM